MKTQAIAELLTGSRNLKNKRFLVTGGAGFIGSNLVRHIIDEIPGSRVTVVDNLSYAGNLHNLDGVPKSRMKFVRADINYTPLMKKLFKVTDYVMHLAAESHVDRSIHQSSLIFLNANVLGTHSLLEALRASPNVRLFLHVSTDEVFGTLPLASKAKFNERSAYLPNSPYAASKAAGDMVVRSFYQTWKLPIIIAHPVNNYGPRQLPEKMIPFFTMRAMNDLPLPLYGHGGHIRSWLHVNDCSRALLAILQKGQAGESYCISADEDAPNHSVALTILRTLKKPKDLITYVTDRPGHDERYALDASKLKRLGWKPNHALSVHLPKTVLWYKDNTGWTLKTTRNRKQFNKHIKSPALGSEKKMGYFAKGKRQ